MKRISARYDAYRDFRRARWEDVREAKRKERSRDKAPSPIFRGEKRRHVVQQAMDILGDWRSSPFEHEAMILHGMRQGLCMNGYDWRRADWQAHEIVAEGLRLLGAERPTWEEGQLQYTDPPDVCTWCKRPFSEEQMQGARRPRFCSPECARVAIQRRDWQNSYIDTKVGRAAYLLIRNEEGVRRACKACGKEFGVPFNNLGQIYCSTVCSNRVNRHADKTCLNCGILYHPRTPDQLCCSRACRDGLGRLPQFHKQCVYCARWFMGKFKRSKHCSPHCRSMDYHYGVKRVRPKVLHHAAFDYFVVPMDT